MLLWATGTGLPMTHQNRHTLLGSRGGSSPWSGTVGLMGRPQAPAAMPIITMPGKTSYSDYSPKPNPTRKATRVQEFKRTDRSFISSSQRHDFVGSRVWLVSQCWFQGVTHGTPEARSQLCTCSVPAQRQEKPPTKPVLTLARQSYSHQQKGKGALKGLGMHQDSWHHWVKGKLTKSCLGSHQPGPRCLDLPLPP